MSRVARRREAVLGDLHALGIRLSDRGLRHRLLGLEVGAEGVETEAIWDRLRDLGCNVAQGYFLSRPVPAEKLQAWLEERRGESAGGEAAA